MSGQTVNVSTGAVEGRVLDGTSAVLAGVAIKVSSDSLMLPRETLTDTEGFYRFPALPPDLAGREYSISRASGALLCCWDTFAASVNEDGSAVTGLTVLGGSFSDLASA